MQEQRAAHPSTRSFQQPVDPCPFAFASDEHWYARFYVPVKRVATRGKADGIESGGLQVGRQAEAAQHPRAGRGRGHLAQRHVPVALGEPRAVRAEHERHVGVRRLGKAERPREEELARRGVEQVVAAHDLLDALGGVVDHDREVVGDRPVVAAHHEVVDHALDVAVQAVGEADALAVGAYPQGRRSRRPPRLPLGLREPQAGAGIVAFGQRAVRRRRRLADLGPRAEALVQAPAGAQLLDGRRVAVPARRLVGHLAVPVDPDGGEVGELLLGDARPDAAGVEVLHAHEEAAARRAGEQPRQQRGPQVAEVERARRAGREAALHTENGSESAISASRGAVRSRSE